MFANESREMSTVSESAAISENKELMDNFFGKQYLPSQYLNKI